jgi:regulator of sirC expression with transglutaminase-like and TPR domain
MLEASKIQALLSLLDDSEQEVWQAAYAALAELPYTETDTLQNYLYEAIDSPETKTRLEQCIVDIRIKHFGELILNWKNKGGENLLEAMVYICQFRYPDVTELEIMEQLETLRLDAWLEFHYDLTSFEKVKILNYILFQLHGFRGDEENFLHHDNSFINKVLQNKKGNPISLSIVYMLVAQRLNIPVYGINLPRHFIMAYVEDEETNNLEGFNDKQIIRSEAQGEIKFYINAYNGGGVFNQEQLQGILKEMDLEEKPEYMQPCSNADIVLRVIMNLYNSYSVAKKPEADFVDRVVQKLRDL